MPVHFQKFPEADLDYHLMHLSIESPEAVGGREMAGQGRAYPV